MFQVGDLVVYCAQKHSDHPTLNAESVQPEAHGEGYRYLVRKYWVVAAVAEDGSVEVLTRRGKHRSVVGVDPMLRHAYWWERMFFSDRFPQLESPPTNMQASSRAG